MLRRDIEKYIVQHENMYNINKLGICIGQGKKEKVFIIYNKAAQCKAGKAFNCKFVMVIETICMDGYIILFCNIFKGKTH